MFQFFKKKSKKNLSQFFNYILKSLNFFIIYRIGNSIGDQVCMTSVIRLISEHYDYKIVVISSHPEIFKHNPRITRCFAITKDRLYWSKILRFLSGPRLENFLFKNTEMSFESYMQTHGDSLHLAKAHALHFELKISFSKIVNEIYFSPLEIETFNQKFDLPEVFSVVQPNAKLTYTPNKQWKFDNFQYVINKIQNINWIQVGESKESLLDNVEDYRGKTSLREMFYLVSRAHFVFANEGLMNHVASAFNIKSYVISSGFSNIALSKYQSSVFFDSSHSCDQSPCWLKSECGVENKPCLSNISPETVVQSLL